MMSAARSAAWATSAPRWPTGRRPVRPRDRDRSEQLPARAQRHGQRAVVELDEAAAVGERLAQRAPGDVGRAALGVGDHRAPRVDHPDGRAAGPEHLVQATAQLLHELGERPSRRGRP